MATAAWLGNDASGNNNYWIASNVSLSSGATYDSMVDVPGIAAVSAQNDVGGVVRGNYTTLNPILQNSWWAGPSRGAISNGNLRMVQNNGSCFSTFDVTTPGKWYCEVTLTTSGNTGASASGVIIAARARDTYECNYLTNGNKQLSPGTTLSSYGSTYTTGDIIGVAIDSIKGTVTYYKNGVSQGVINKPFPNEVVYVGWYAEATGTDTVDFNFGQRPFSYTPPVGYKSFCTTNLSNPVIKRPNEHFDAKWWYGNNTGIILGNSVKQSSAYPVPKSVRLRGNSASVYPYMKRIPSAAGNRKTWTLSLWVKQTTTGDQKLFTAGAGGDDNNFVNLYYGSAGTLRLSAWTYDFMSGYVGQADHSLWNHIVISVDTTKDSSVDRVKVFFNGKRYTNTGTVTMPAQNADLGVNSVAGHWLGASRGASGYLDGYISEVNFVDGQQLDATAFGAFDANNNWMPSKYLGTYGTNGYYLPFSDTTAPTVYAATFNSESAQFLSTPTAAGFNLAGVDWTIEAYVMPTGNQPGTGDTFFLQSQQGYNNWIPDLGIGINASGYFSAAINGTGYTSTTLSTKNTWHHVALVRSGGVVKLYVNGVATSISVTTNLRSQNMSWWIGKVDNAPGGGTYLYYFNGLISNLRIVKSSALYTTTFTPPTLPLTAVTGTQLLTCYNTGLTDGSANAITITNNNVVGTTYLTGSTPSSSNTSNITKDSSGNNNHWFASNISLASGATYDAVLDSPADYDSGNGTIYANYPTLTNFGSSTASPVSGGGLTVISDGTTSYLGGKATFGAYTGKWYAEWITTAYSGGNTASDYEVGVDIFDDWADAGRSSNGVTYLGGPNSDSGKFRVAGGNPVAYGGASYTVNDVIGIAMDLDNDRVSFYKNNVLQATISLPGVLTADKAYTFGVQSAGGLYAATGRFNFGQIPFTYTPPAGFKALNTKNLKDIGSYSLPDNFGNYVNSPDLFWCKALTSTANWAVVDSNRGPLWQLQSSTTNAQSQNSTGNGVQAFVPNGVIIGKESDAIGGMNAQNVGYVGYFWNKGQTPGFDIVQYGGDAGAAGKRNIPHNLGVAPDVIFIKAITGTSAGSYHWIVQHKGIGQPLASAQTFNLNSYTSALLLSGTGAKISYSFDNQVNASGYTYIAYLWAEVPGFSKFSSYVGNGSTDGPFVYTGFKPRYILIKDVTNASDWYVYDTTRELSNPMQKPLNPNYTYVESASGRYLDVLSNGFKLRVGSATNPNVSGDTYIYMAFAETPSKYALAR